MCAGTGCGLKSFGGGVFLWRKCGGKNVFFFDIPLPLFEFAFIGRVSEILLGQKNGFFNWSRDEGILSERYAVLFLL